jgi:DNA-binding Xre family transcriptional regulator
MSDMNGPWSGTPKKEQTPFDILANRMGITAAAVQELIAGKVPMAVSSRLKVPTPSLQKFLDGGTSAGLAQLIGCTPANLQELRKGIGKAGAIGFLMGLCSRRAEGHPPA